MSLLKRGGRENQRRDTKSFSTWERRHTLGLAPNDTSDAFPDCLGNVFGARVRTLGLTARSGQIMLEMSLVRHVTC